jgi:antitoxin ParD1/3/4
MRETKSTSFTLKHRDIAFITDMVTNGRFGNRTEVIRAGLRLLEDYENNSKAKRLEALIGDGVADISAGNVTEYNATGEFAQDIINRGKERLKAID